MGRRPTINDVAEAAGVSVATVSKAVNGRYGVAVETVERVLQVVQELGYESSLVASSMRSRRTGVIGVLVADFEPFSAEILKGVGEALRDTSYDLLAYSGSRGDEEGWERRSLSRLSGTLIDGAIMVTPTVVRASADVPLVAIDPHTGPAGLPTVDSDGYGGARLAMQHLIGLGHRRIAHIAGPAPHGGRAWRLSGYRDGLRRAGIEYDESLVVDGGFSFEAGVAGARQLLDLDDPPTAIFAANDDAACGVMHEAFERGLRIPDDLSVIGFDDTPTARQIWPSLTTVRQPCREMGRIAAEQLLADIREPGAGRLVHAPYELKLRNSTGPAPVSTRLAPAERRVRG